MKLPVLYPILDTATLDQCQLGWVSAAEAILEGGAKILQFRHKGPFTRRVFRAAEQIAALCQRAGAVYVIDDRADIARILNAGLHLGQDDLPPREARKILGDDAVVGFSTHNEQQLREAASEPVDYLALGPIFATRSKARPDPVVGLENLSRWRTLTDRPLVAIGGITRENAQDVLRAGADSVAVIADLYPIPCTRLSLRARIEEWLQLLRSNPA